MDSIDTAIPGVKVVTPTVYGDDRGFFKEIIHPQKLAKIGINQRFVQVKGASFSVATICPIKVCSSFKR